jgi:putative acetyltransferase
MLSRTDPLSLKIADVHSQEAHELMGALTQELKLRYGDDGGVNGFRYEDFAQKKAVFVLARWEREAIGCGAIIPLQEDIAEIKRMYVAPLFRGKGISRQILIKLEDLAQSYGFQKIWLETGTEQPEAISLYFSCGYHPIPLYGYYKDDPRSRCFEKSL